VSRTAPENKERRGDSGCNPKREKSVILLRTLVYDRSPGEVRLRKRGRIKS